MSVFKKQIVKGSVSNLTGILLGVVNNLWIFPLAFSLEQLGVYRWVERTGVLIATIALLGLHRLYVRFQSRYTGESAAQFLSNIVLGVLAAALLVGAGLSFFGDRLARALDVEFESGALNTLGAVVAGTMMYALGLSIAASSKRISLPFFLKNVGIRLALVLSTVAFLAQLLSFENWMKVFALIHLLVGGVVLYYAFRLKKMPLVRPRSLADGSRKTFLAFSGSGIAMAIMTMSLTTIDSQMIASLIGVEALGVYSIAFFVGSFVDGIRRPVSQALSPQFANLWNEGNTVSLGKIYARTSRVLLAVALVAFMVIVPNLDWLFSFIPNAARFDAAKPVVLLILVSRVVDYAFGSNGEMLSNGPYYQWNLLILTVLVAGIIGLNFWLLPLLGITGAGWTLVIAYTLFNIAKAWLLWVKERLQPFSKVHLIMLVIAGLGTFGAMQFNDLTLLHHLLRNSVILLSLGVAFFALRKKL